MTRGKRMELMFLACLLSSCAGPPEAPARPTWADVEPILRGACDHCHGATAGSTAQLGGIPFRFDFYDMNEAVCGDAARAVDTTGFALAWAGLIRDDVTPPDHGAHRPRMPPAPAQQLEDWQRETLQRWGQAPIKGDPHRDNHRPQIQITDVHLPGKATPLLKFQAVVDDPDGEAVVGIVTIGDQILKMPRPGSFAARLDTTTWPAGAYPVRAVLCDGWEPIVYELGVFAIPDR